MSVLLRNALQIIILKHCSLYDVKGVLSMAKYLVIVESPAKVKTIKKFLGKNYEVMASNGHVRDLPKSQLGIDVEGDFEPKYITIRGKGEILAKLRKEAKKLTRYTLQLTLTVKERLFRGIYMQPSNLKEKMSAG